jgi:hypothetical protein
LERAPNMEFRLNLQYVASFFASSTTDCGPIKKKLFLP